MSGQGGILAFGIIALTIIPMLFSIALININYHAKLINNLTYEYNELNKALWSKIRISDDSITWIDSYTVILNVSNVGYTSIRTADFKYITIIIKYTSNGRNITLTIPYNQNYNGDGAYWKVLNCSLESGREVSNPIRIYPDGHITGIWDPKEILTIEIHLPVNYPRDSNTPYMIAFITPDGASDYAYGG